MEKENWPLLTAAKVLEVQKTSSNQGLSETQAQERLSTYGYNVLEKFEAISPFKIFLRQFQSFFLYLLIFAAGITLSLGEYLEAGVILIIIVLNVALGFYQEFRAERTLEHLRKLTSPLARLLREGKTKMVPAKEVVPGDIVLLEEGDIVPADGRLLEAITLEVDESLLTGESLPVLKIDIPLEKKVTNPAEMVNMAFSGTVVTKGRGRMVVTATGLKGEMGKVSQLLQRTLRVETPLKKKIDLFSKRLGWLVVGLVVFLFVLGVFQKKEIFELFLTSVSLAVATVPEALPIVITLVLALGVQEMARKRALIRRLPAVETLGSITTILTDKTGTLTENKLAVKKLFLQEEYQIPENKELKGLKTDPLTKRFLETAWYCNNAKLPENPGEPSHGDPLEIALKELVEKVNFPLRPLKRLKERPFDSTRKMMSVWVEEAPQRGILLVKGAPEVTLEKSDRLLKNNGTLEILTPAKRLKFHSVVEAWAEKAYRVLALAFGEKEKEEKLVFLGLAAFVDPPRPEVKEALATAQKAGIRVVMLTGDHLKTALSIGQELGIAWEPEEAIDGQELRAKSFEELRERLKKVRVFARVTPEEKLIIVKELQALGEIVAMTGDGVNDAPALKRAEVGVAMGLRGTEVAKEASEMVLTDDNFSTIVSAIKEGRKIYENIKKVIFYLLKTNFGEIIVVATAFFTGYPLVITPLMILWVNLVTDNLPALAFAKEPSSLKLMEKPPRHPKEEILSRERLFSLLFLGGLLATFTLGLFFYYYSSLNKARSMAFNMLSIGQLFMVFGFRDTFLKNFWMFLGVGVSLGLQVIVFYLPFTIAALKLVPPSPLEWLLVLALSLVLALVTFPVRKRVGI